LRSDRPCQPVSPPTYCFEDLAEEFLGYSTDAGSAVKHKFPSEEGSFFDEGKEETERKLDVEWAEMSIASKNSVVGGFRFLPVCIGVVVPIIDGANGLLEGGLRGFVIQFAFPHFIDGGIPSYGCYFTLSPCRRSPPYI
jgi:hypothetical protein